MPGGDRTGPVGRGSRSGRGLGYCSGFDVPGFARGGRGGGAWSCGWGGRGWRNRFYATGLTGWQRGARGWEDRFYEPPYPSASWRSGREQVVDELKAQAGYFEDALRDIRKRIQDLESAS